VAPLCRCSNNTTASVHPPRLLVVPFSSIFLLNSLFFSYNLIPFSDRNLPDGRARTWKAVAWSREGFVASLKFNFSQPISATISQSTRRTSSSTELKYSDRNHRRVARSAVETRHPP
jgi:hypothetical protein